MRILIADDHPLVRQGLASTIERLAGFDLVAEAEDGLAALEAIRAHTPDIVVIDISMPRLDGLEVLAQAATWPSSPRFVVLTMYEELVRRALSAGALGYLLKEDATNEIAACLCSVAAGRRYISRRLPAGVLEADSPSSAALAVLTEGERRVLRLVARHMTSREIADLMKLSHRTVQNHRASMVRKLELRGSSALLRFALAHAAELEREP